MEAQGYNTPSRLPLDWAGSGCGQWYTNIRARLTFGLYMLIFMPLIARPL